MRPWQNKAGSRKTTNGHLESKASMLNQTAEGGTGFTNRSACTIKGVPAERQSHSGLMKIKISIAYLTKHGSRLERKDALL